MNRLKKQDATAVAALLERGYSARAIERILGVNRNTVLSHDKRIKRKQGRRGTLGRPALPEGEAKGKIIPIRFTQADHAAMIEKAKNCKSLSEWMRRALRKAAREVLSEKTNHETDVPLQV